jgi:hypothetical protein
MTVTTVARGPPTALWISATARRPTCLWTITVWADRMALWMTGLA